MRHHIASLTLSLPAVGDSTLPEGCNVQLLPDGAFSARDGRPASLTGGKLAEWHLNADIAAALIADATARATPLVVDYEHQTLVARDKGIAAPAAGWFAALTYVPGKGLYTKSDWTERAQGYIDAREYQYISPVFTFDPATGAVTRLLSAALTNNPALDGMASVALSLGGDFVSPTPLTTESHMDELLERIRWMLNLPVTATAEEIAAELDKLRGQITGTGEAAAAFVMPPGGLCAILRGHMTQLAALAATAAQPDPAQYAPVAALSEMQGTIAALTQQVADLQAARQQSGSDALIVAALKDGRLPKALEPWARDLAQKDMAALTAFLDKAPSIAALGGIQSTGTPPPAHTSAALTAEEQWACSMLDMAPEQLQGTKEAR